MVATPTDTRRARGFHPAGSLVASKLATAARRRGFVELRLLTEWEAIAGPQVAAAAQPVKLTRTRGAGRGESGGGGILTIRVEGARAPEVQMLLPAIKSRLNAALGWAAVSQIRITQSNGGFAEATTPFRAAPPPPPAPTPAPATLEPVLVELSSIGDGGLRAALETLARNVLSRPATTNRTGPR